MQKEHKQNDRKRGLGLGGLVPRIWVAFGPMPTHVEGVSLQTGVEPAVNSTLVCLHRCCDSCFQLLLSLFPKRLNDKSIASRLRVKVSSSGVHVRS